VKAFVVERYGKVGLRAADVPEPEVGDGDVLVKVSAAGVNPLDVMIRNGEFKRLLKYRTPFVLGHDVAVEPGQKVLVHAGSGGLGSTVIQLAKHLGASVATTASGSNAELVRSLGADVVVDYRNEDFAEVLSGYDVVLDSLGGENLEKSLTVLKAGGQAIGAPARRTPGSRSSSGRRSSSASRWGC
jgi:NADPH:quinone reductase-like Zn-dependent oxidoreductase